MSITHLPVELLANIAECAVERHPTLGYAIDSSALSALSTVNNVFREVSLPTLYREIPITSEYQLDALSRANPTSLSRLR